MRFASQNQETQRRAERMQLQSFAHPTGTATTLSAIIARPINTLNCALLPQKLRHGAVHAARSKMNATDNCLSTVHLG